MMLGVGDVASNCGPNPCGFMDTFFASTQCGTWQSCAAVENAGAGGVPALVASGACVEGGVDATGNTIVSCGGAPTCLMGSGPLAPGQAYCAGVLDAAQTQAAEYFAAQGNQASVSS